MKSEIKNLWPTKIVIHQYDKLELNKVLREIYKYYIETHELIKGSGKLTGREEPQVLEIPLPEVAELKGMFAKAFDELSTAYHPKIDIIGVIDGNPRISIMKDRDYRQTHVHANTAAFGIYYIDTGDVDASNTGLLELHDPRHLDTIIFTDPTIETIKPKDGMLIVAPSYLAHAVTPYYGSKERVAIVCEILVPDRNPIEKALKK